MSFIRPQTTDLSHNNVGSVFPPVPMFYSISNTADRNFSQSVISAALGVMAQLINSRIQAQASCRYTLIEEM
jgi:hypothetical protein